MANYQQVEYTIDKDGNLTEKVLNVKGEGCLALTAEVEAALGVVEKRDLLPEFLEQTVIEETPAQQLDWTR